MQIHTHEPVQWLKIEEGLFSRKKNGRENLYRKGELLGSGKRANVWDLIPLQGGKHKALKISKCPYSVKDSEISLKVHSQGLVAGLIKPSKAFFDETDHWITILPRYEGSLKQLLMAKKISALEVVQGLQEVFDGLRHLHQLQIAHCDLCLSNILIGTWKGKRRFDIADFERCVDFSGFTKIEEFFEAFEMRKLNTLRKVVINSPSDQLRCCKGVIIKQDIWSFGVLVQDLKLYTHGKLIEMLFNLGDRIVKNFSLERVRDTLVVIENAGKVALERTEGAEETEGSVKAKRHKEQHGLQQTTGAAAFSLEG